MSIREHNQEPARPAPRPAPAAATGETRRGGIIGRLQNMLEEVLAEIRKVTWPTQTETRNLTIVVIGISILVGGLLGIIDLLLTGLIQALTNGAAGL